MEIIRSRFSLWLFTCGIILSGSAHFPVSGQTSFYLREEGWIETVGERLIERPAFEFVNRDPSLPDILLIGNSISIGYTPEVRSLLKGVANVYRIPENGGDTDKFLERYETWLSDMDWDVIHINIGLHDLKRVDENGDLDVQCERRISPDRYQANLEKVFGMLKNRTSAHVIWATTTFVPEGSAGRITGDEELYNRRSVDVLKQYPDFYLNDLYGYSLGIKSLQREANVHYFPDGYEKLGRQVARSIGERLDTNL